MHILHLDEQRGWRGGEQQASWLIEGLVKRGQRVSLAGRPGEAFLESEHGGAGVERHGLAFRGEWDLGTARAIGRIVRNEQVDVIHAHTSHAHTLACVARRMAGRGRVVVSRRVSFAPKNNPINRLKYRCPDQFLAVSGKVAEVLLKFGVPENLVSVVHSAVDLARLDVSPLSRQDLGISDEVPLLVNAGALVGHKDHETLVAMMALVLKSRPEARLVIAGEGELRPRIEAAITRFGIEHAVTLLGHRSDAPRIIRAGDVYVSSSWSEGLGTSVLEALACGVPVVAAVAGGIPEMVIDGETGYIVPNRNPEALADGVLQSLEHPERAQSMAEAGKRLVRERFTVERMVEGTIEAYERVVGG